MHCHASAAAGTCSNSPGTVWILGRHEKDSVKPHQPTTHKNKNSGSLISPPLTPLSTSHPPTPPSPQLWLHACVRRRLQQWNGGTRLEISSKFSESDVLIWSTHQNKYNGPFGPFIWSIVLKEIIIISFEITRRAMMTSILPFPSHIQHGWTMERSILNTKDYQGRLYILHCMGCTTNCGMLKYKIHGLFEKEGFFYRIFFTVKQIWQ